MEKYELEPNIHHYMGIELNMQTWNLLSKKNRNKQDNDRMVAFAKSSLYHWYHSPNYQPINAQRGEWMISHVYAVLKMEDKALEHAKNCLKLTEELDIVGFDMAYSYEAIARAYALKGNKTNAEKYIELAKESGNKIESKEDRKIFFEDFNAEPWNGMK